MPRQDLAGAPQRAADDLAEIVQGGVRHDRAGLQLGHVEQVGDEAVEPLGLVDDRREQLGLFGVAQLARQDRAAFRPHPSIAGQRRLEVVRDRGQQRRAQPVGLDRALDAVHVLDQMHALDRQRALVDQGVEQAALVGRQQRPGLVAVDADDADGAAAGAHRQEQPLGAGQRVGAAPGGPVVLPRPFGGREIRVVERVLGRIAGLDGDRAVLRQQQHDAHLQHQRGLIGGRPQHVVERADAGQLAAEGVERLRRARALVRGHGLRAHARGDVARR